MMREKFKKIVGIVGSLFMVCFTTGMAMAAGGNFPSPLVSENSPNYAIVTGTNAASSDVVGAGFISDYLETFYDVSPEEVESGKFFSSIGVTESEVPLGNSITPYFREIYTDNKISTLYDGEVNWNNGEDSKGYDVHEEIILSDGLKLKTNLDNEDLEDEVVLENDKSFKYKYVFDDALDVSLVGDEDANNLYLTILGKEYEVVGMEENSITLSFSEEKVVTVGETIVSDGISLLVGDIFEDSIEINGNFVDKGETKTIDGVEVYVDSIGYHNTADLSSKAIIKIGKDISSKIEDGDEYVEDDESWVWEIKDLGETGGYIGVSYNIKSVGYDEDETLENAISIGNSYVIPENYGAIVFESLNGVDYETVELYFDDADLYRNSTGESKLDNEDVFILNGENEDSIHFTLDSTPIETSSIYLRYIPSGYCVENRSENETECSSSGHNWTNAEMYFKDIDGDIDDDHEGRKQLIDEVVSDLKVVVGETELEVSYDSTTKKLTLSNDVEDLVIPLEVSGGKFTQLGTEEEDAESTDLVVTDSMAGTKNLGTREDDVLTHYGLVLKSPESEADADRVTIEVPDEQVFAEISVKGKGKLVETSDGTEDTSMDGNSTVDTSSETSVPEVGGIVIKDSEVMSHTDKNLVIVGGSCINGVAAGLLGGQFCGEEFTSKTGIGSGQYLIQTFTSPTNSEKVAILVAGYEAADTTNAVSRFISGTEDFGVVGTKVTA